MVRLESWIRALCLGCLLAGLAGSLSVTPASAQAADPFAIAERFARIQATTDSLAYGTAAADSVDEVAPAPKQMGGFMGMVDRSAWGGTPSGQTFVAGGPFMWWILIVAIVGFIIIIERLLTLSRARVNTRRLLGIVMTTLRNDGVHAAGVECQKVRGPVAAVLYSGLQNADQDREVASRAMSMAGTIEMSYLERGLVWVSSVSTLAPLLGFIGSVYGMIRVLDGFAAAHQITSSMVMRGIAESLVCAAFGLVVAVPASLAYSYLVKAIGGLVVDMEESGEQLLGELESRRG